MASRICDDKIIFRLFVMGRILVNPVMSLKETESGTKNGTQSKDMRRRFLVTLTHIQYVL